MVMMSEDVELMFNSGSSVSVKNCHQELIEGEVIAFDYNKRVLLVKRPSKSGQNPNHQDIHLINLDTVEDVKINKEVKKEDLTVSTLPHLNVQKVEQRARVALDERRRLANAFNSGITQEGLKLYLSLCKTIGQRQVSFDQKNIIVMDNVLIGPPYNVDNCVPRPPNSGAAGDRKSSGKLVDAVKYIQTLVEKYWSGN